MFNLFLIEFQNDIGQSYNDPASGNVILLNNMSGEIGQSQDLCYRRDADEVNIICRKYKFVSL